MIPSILVSDPTEQLRLNYGSSGAFFLYDAVSQLTVEWKPRTIYQTCRESFAHGWQFLPDDINPPSWLKSPFRPDITRWIGMVVGSPVTKLDVESIAARWAEIETMLGLADRTVVHRSANQTNVVVVHLSPFWIKTDTHRSLCTLLLRGAIVHPGTSFDNSLDLYTIASWVKPAIKRFLAGYTHPTYERLTRCNQGGGAVGFVSEYLRLSDDELVAKLIKPPV
jgi:hypothetical protein